MYTNIATDEGIATIQKYIETFGSELDYVLPTDLICNLLEMVMTSNIFQFGDTWWKQKNGTAMGTSCACIYSTLFFGYFERTILLPKYKNNILFFKRMIDDILIIWVPTSPSNSEWQSFISDLNSCCSLSWETEELTNKTHFLDLNIWINKNNKISYSTYQKDMNLFLYIPQHSAHPVNTTKSLIFSLLKTYRQQNPNQEDFNNICTLFFNRLRVRGHSSADLKSHFKDALRRLSKTQQPRQHNYITPITPTTPKPPNLQQLFLHLQYHPKGLSQRVIQHHYHNICETKPTQFPQRIPTTQLPTQPTILDSESQQHSQHTPSLTSTPGSLMDTDLTANEGFNNMHNNSSGSTMKIKGLTVAYSRPKNLRDLLCPSKLKEFDDLTVSSTINNFMK